MAMGDNPYEAPRTAPAPVAGVGSGLRKDLRAVAVAQKRLLVCLLLQLVLIGSVVLLPPEVRLYVRVAALIVGLAGAICVFLLAVRVYSLGVGIVLALFAFFPCVGLLILLAVNIKATKLLRQDGIRVGLLGADLSQFPVDV